MTYNDQSGRHEQKRAMRFTDLEVWKVNHDLALKVCVLSTELKAKNKELFADPLVEVVRRINQNLVQGYCRRDHTEKRHYYYESRGATFELQDLLLLVADSGVLKKEDREFDEMLSLLLRGRRMINGLLSSFDKSIKEDE